MGKSPRARVPSTRLWLPRAGPLEATRSGDIDGEPAPSEATQGLASKFAGSLVPRAGARRER